MACILGIDPSLTHFTVVSSSGNEYQLKPKTRGVERLMEISDELYEILTLKEAPSLIVLEGYSYASPNQAHQIGELGGVVRITLAKLCYSENEGNLLIVPPTKLKKFACGRGNAKKDEIMMRVFKKWGYEAKDDNFADAFALMKYGETGGI